MKVLSQLIKDALESQGAFVRYDGNGDVSSYIPQLPASIARLSLDDVLTPKGGKQLTLNGVLADRSLVVSAGATVIRILPNSQSSDLNGDSRRNLSFKDVPGKFVTIKPASFSSVDDESDLVLGGVPYFVAAYDSETAPSYGVGFQLTRRELLHDFEHEEGLTAISAAIEAGIANLADYVLLNYLETAATDLPEATFKSLASAVAAKKLRWDEVKALSGGDCTGLEVDGAGILRAFGVRAEITGETNKTILGDFSRAAVAIDDDIRVVVKRGINGGVEIVVWLNAAALVPDNTYFWKA